MPKHKLSFWDRLRGWHRINGVKIHNHCECPL